MGLPIQIESKSVDISYLSNTLPPIREIELEREHVIKNIEETFTATNRTILIEGFPATGKSTLLAQFIRRHKSNSISFFIGEDYWKSNTSFFLSELCLQMAAVSSEGLKKHLSNVDIENLKEFELIQLFRRLYTDLCKQTRQKRTPFYIVIDGLDKIHLSNEDNILKYIPHDSSEGVYVLLSSVKGKDYDFDYYSMQIPFFSRLETENILKDYLSKDEINYVYSVCNGMPGYISEILRQLKENKLKETVITNLPPSFNFLLEKTWLQYDINDKDFTRLLSLIAYSIESISLDDVKGILSITEVQLSRYLEEISFIVVEENKLELLSAYKNFFKDKLINFKAEVVQDLVIYYENISNEQKAMIYLPELYQEQRDYHSLVKLVDIENIYNQVQNTQQLSSVRKNLRILTNMANTHKDWKHLSWSILTESVFTQIATTPPAIENQVLALLSLNQYKESIRLAYSCVLPEDRLILLSHVCRYMYENKIDISSDITNSIEESITLIDNTVNLSDELINKLIDICSNIFPFNTSLSLKLLERVVSKTGENIEQEKLMDYLLIRLLLRVGNESEETEQIKSQIGNDHLQNFINAISDSLDKDSVNEVFEKIKLINDISAKLFYLQNWCEKNKDNSDSYKVVEYALNIMTESNDYTPTLRHLRQFTEPLIHCTNLDIAKKLISKIENLKSTIIKKPIEEYARLELVFAKIEKKWSSEMSTDRYYNLYISLDEVDDYDGKCLILVHLLQSYPDLLNNDPQLYKDLRDQLIMDFNRLITSSAEHFTVTKKILTQLTLTDRYLAFKFASKLNTKQRVYRSYAEILKSHVNEEQVDFDFIEKVLDKIDEKPYKDWVFVQLLKRLVANKLEVNKDIKFKYFGKIKNIDSVTGKSLALAYYLTWIVDEPSKCAAAFNELKSNLERIDEVNEKKKLGYKIVQILSESHIDYAEDLYNVVLNYNQNNIFDTRLSALFSQIIELLIRMVPDILKSEDYKFKLKHIKNIILSIPSSYEQCVLLSNFALRCSVNGYKHVIPEAIERCLDILEKCSGDYNAYSRIVVEIAPLLFEYEKSLFFEKLQTLNSSILGDAAIKNIIKFIISKRPIEDPIDFQSFQQKVDYPEALKICELLSHLQVDSNIFAMISTLVDAIVEPAANRKYRSKLREKQLLNVTEKIIEIIEGKLPDKENIQHDGYKIASYGCLTKLRDTSSHRANDRWNSLFPTRNELKRKALDIPNVSDKIFVLANLGKSGYFSEEVFGMSLIKEAEENLQYLSNPLDRAERYELVAESYKETSNSKAARFVLEQAMGFARACSHEQGRDKLIGGLLDLAHSIDPDLAQSYASNADSTDSMVNLSERITTLNLHSDPKKIQNYNKEQTDTVLYEFFIKVLKTVCSGRGTIQHEEVIGQYLNYSVGQSFETIILGISWFVENTIASNKNLRESYLSELFVGVLQLLELIRNVEISIYESSATIMSDNFYKVLTETNIQTFGLDEQEEALSTITNWVKTNVKDYLRIYDPYFNEEMLEILRHTSDHARVFIYTSAKSAELELLSSRYKSYWGRICGHLPPETHFYVFSTSSGETPIHDRFIICEQSGLKLGTSLNGFGSKFSTITYLDFEEKEKIEKEIISPLITMPPTQYKKDRLLMKMFSL